MKVTISFLEDEKPEVAVVVAALQRLHPGMKMRKSDRHPPFRHVYLTTGKAKIPGKNT